MAGGRRQWQEAVAGGSGRRQLVVGSIQSLIPSPKSQAPNPKPQITNDNK